jgi:putative GTP pyrophosphokinase
MTFSVLHGNRARSNCDILRREMDFTKSQIDRLGERLRKGGYTPEDLRLLDSYRRAFTNAYEGVISAVVSKLGLAPTGRPAKSTNSIIDKLQRESIRLSQMQDIAGCRVTVADLIDQDDVIHRLGTIFEQHTVVDRRDNPSHGYRAVHVVVEQNGKLIEIQVRTSLQHLWAEVSEKLADVLGSEIKYGKGDKDVQIILSIASQNIQLLELEENRLFRIMESDDTSPEVLHDEGPKFADIAMQKFAIITMLNAVAEVLPVQKAQRNDISD